MLTHNSGARRFKGILHRIGFLIVLSAVIYASSTAFSSPLTTDNIFSKLISVESSGGYGTLVFEIRNPHPSAEMAVNAATLKGISVDVKGNPTLSMDAFYLKSFNSTHYARNMTSCINTTLAVNDNGTETDLTCSKMPEYTFVEKRFAPLSDTVMLPPGESLTIKMEARWRPGLGFQSRDIQPSITFNGAEYVQDKWSYLNSNYSFYKPVSIFENASIDRYNQPIWVNLSADPDFSLCCSDTKYTDVFVSSNYTGTEMEIASDIVNGSARGWSENDWFVVFLVNLTGASGNRSMNETYKIYANNTADTTYTKYSAGITDGDGTGYEADCAFRINTTINGYHLCTGTGSADRGGIRGANNNSVNFRFADSNYVAWAQAQYKGLSGYSADRYYNGSVVRFFRMTLGTLTEYYGFYGDSPYLEVTLLDPTLPAQGSASDWHVHMAQNRDADKHILMDNPLVQQNPDPGEACSTIKFSKAASLYNSTNDMTLSVWRNWLTREQTTNTTSFCQHSSADGYRTYLTVNDAKVNLSNVTMFMSFKTLTNKGADNQTNMKELIYQLHYTLGPVTAYLSVGSTEAAARNAIENGIRNVLGNTTIYTDQFIYTRNSSGSQNLGRFDKIAMNGTKSWAFNYITGSDSYTSMLNITPSVYFWENENLTEEQITTHVELFINQSK